MVRDIFSSMVYKILADAIVLIHLLWIVFLFLGALWGRRNKVVRIVHLSALFFALIIQVFDWFCPLTHLEFLLRGKHHPDLAYAGSFIIYYVERIVYIEISRCIVLIVTLLLGTFNIWIYLRK